MMIDLKREIPSKAARLRALATDADSRGLPTCAGAMRDAAVDLEQMLALHVGLAEREERLTSRLVALTP